MKKFTAKPIPHPEVTSISRTEFRHPAYDEPTNSILILPRVDKHGILLGVDYTTALMGCRIIANNAFHGYLATDLDGKNIVSESANSILTEKFYYFIVPDGSDTPAKHKYPVVPSFRDWCFPHDEFPRDYWVQPHASPTKIGYSSRCAITSYSCYTEYAHLVPKEEHTWYLQNGMKKYEESTSEPVDPANTVTLRPDFHPYFDARWLVIVPKINRSNGDIPQYVTHILNDKASELWPDYHNTLAQYLHIGSQPFLFARFACSIILKVKNFITSGIPRLVVRITYENGQRLKKVEEVGGAQLMQMYGGGGSKAATPMKPKSAAASVDDGEISSDASGDFGRTWEGNRREQNRSEETAPDPEILGALLQKAVTEEKDAAMAECQ